MLYPEAIADDEYVSAESNASSDEDVESTKVRRKKKRLLSDFTDSFRFADEGEARAEDHLDGLKKFLEKRTPSSLQINIEKERAELKKTVLASEYVDEEIEVGADQLDNEDDDDLVQEMADMDDRVREKAVKLPKKQAAVNSYFDEASKDLVAAGQQSSIGFQEMNLSRPVLKAVVAAGYTTATSVQASCIPVALAGRDICACSATGTGKTAAFMLPIIERLLFKSRTRAQTRVLVLVPTRELAIQVFQVSRKLSQFTDIDICLCAGGLNLKTQEEALRKGPDIVIATPGRLIDHINNFEVFNLHDIEVLVLDEADKMLDENFAEQMKEIIASCAKNRQTMLFSATMTDAVEELVRLSLDKPVRLFITEGTETAENLRQEFIRVRKHAEGDRDAITASLVTRNFPDHTIVFMRTKKDCERMHILLGLLGVKCSQLHGGLSQTMRVQALQKFKCQELDVLVCTELAARGLDIEGVTTVINATMPGTVQQYIHRVGRTARAGKAGRAVSLVTEEDRKLLKAIVKHNKHTSIKQRNIAPEVIAAYRERIASLESSIKRVAESAFYENQMRVAEEKLAKVEQTVITGKDERQGRVWLKKTQAMKKAEKRLNRSLQSLTQEKEKIERTAEDKAAEREAAFHARQMKRAKQPKRLRAVVDDDDASKKKKRKKSAFTDQLTDVSDRAVKNFRYGPGDREFHAKKTNLKKASKLKNRRKN